jgi:hypothetical protein
MNSIITRKASVVIGSVAAILVAALAVGFISAPDAASAAQYVDVFESRLAPTAAAAKLVAGTDSPTGLAVTAHARSATVVQRAVAPRTAGVRSVRTATTSAAAKTTSGGSAPTGTAAAPAPAPKPATSQASAQSILNRYIAKYPILKGATVSYGDAKGHQAICYYKSGRIVISSSHTRSLETIIAHEIWHIIDWRDNGVIDWGENVPPK